MDELKLDTSIRLAPVVEIKLARADQGVIEGYASTFGGPPDSYGDVVEHGAFSKSLSEHKEAGTMPVFLWSHDPSRPIGHFTEMREDAHGLRVVGQINRETTAGRDAFEHAKAGDVSAFSIGYRVPEGGRRFDKRNTSATLIEVDLLEVSLVALPANRGARVTSTKSIGSKRELEELLQHELRLPRAAARKVAAGGWPALASADQDVATIAAMLEASAAKLRGL